MQRRSSSLDELNKPEDGRGRFTKNETVAWLLARNMIALLMSTMIYDVLPIRDLQQSSRVRLAPSAFLPCSDELSRLLS